MTKLAPSPQVDSLTRTTRISVVVAAIVTAIGFADRIPSVHSFYTSHPNFDGFINWATIVAWIITLFTGATLLHSRISPTVSLLHSLLLEWAKGKASAATTHLVHPGELADFKECFANAIAVRAYNPPLTLLTKNTLHRAVIFSNLNRSEFSYRVIVGETAAGRICDLHKLWTENGVSNEVITRMIVLFAATTGSLSFFLIDHPEERCSVLLYVFGDPFSTSFVVPPKGILLSGTKANNKIYHEMAEAFEARWHELNASSDTDFDERTLPDFFAFWNSRKAAVPNKAVNPSGGSGGL